MKLIGTTETFDPCYVPDWDKRLLESNIVISKKLTDDMIKKLVDNRNKIIFHHTVTGLGGTEIEPNVNSPEVEFNAAKKLIESGFPIEQYVLRVDPIIPFLNIGMQPVFFVLNLFSKLSAHKIRCRISFIDMYDHVKVRFSEAGIIIPYTDFHLPKSVMDECVRSLNSSLFSKFSFESCAEPKFKFSLLISNCGCASAKDLYLLNRNPNEYGYPVIKQRYNCNCLGKKQILGVKPGRCPNKCLYCYWRD